MNRTTTMLQRLWVALCLCVVLFGVDACVYAPPDYGYAPCYNYSPGYYYPPVSLNLGFAYWFGHGHGWRGGYHRR